MCYHTSPPLAGLRRLESLQVGLSAEVEVEARFQLAGQAHPLIRFLALLLGSGITAEGHLCLAWPPGRRMAVTDHSRCWPIPGEGATSSSGWWNAAELTVEQPKSSKVGSLCIPHLLSLWEAGCRGGWRQLGMLGGRGWGRSSLLGFLARAGGGPDSESRAGGQLY